jgi:chromosomal replication initiator protein
MLPTPPLVAVERAIKFRAEVKAPKQLPPSTPAHSVFPGLIADAICAEILSGTGYTVADIKGHRRVFPLVPLRHQCIAAVSEKFLNWSLPRIGRYFGGRDHSTILHSLRCVGAWPRGSYWEAQKHGQMSLFSQGAGK